MTPAARHEFFTRLQALNPHPTTELKYNNHYQLLVAVVLSAQATDKSVNAATEALFKKIKTPKQMMELGEAALTAHIKTIGLYRNKARHVITLSEQLVAHHNGQVPRTRTALEALPGVGRKTANVILNTAFGEETIAVDTHIFRVSNRTRLACGKNVTEVEAKLNKAVPPPFKRHAHHWLILLGRYTCKARSPSCATCPVQDLCPHPKTIQNSQKVL